MDCQVFSLPMSNQHAFPPTRAFTAQLPPTIPVVDIRPLHLVPTLVLPQLLLFRPAPPLPLAHVLPRDCAAVGRVEQPLGPRSLDLRAARLTSGRGACQSSRGSCIVSWNRRGCWRTSHRIPNPSRPPGQPEQGRARGPKRSGSGVKPPARG